MDVLLGAAPRGAEPRLERRVRPARGVDVDVRRAAAQQRVGPGEEDGEGDVDAHRRRQRRQDHRGGGGSSPVAPPGWWGPSVSERGEGNGRVRLRFRFTVLARGVAHALGSRRDKISMGVENSGPGCAWSGGVSESRGSDGPAGVTWWSVRVYLDSGRSRCGSGLVTCMAAVYACFEFYRKLY